MICRTENGKLRLHSNYFRSTTWWVTAEARPARVPLARHATAAHAARNPGLSQVDSPRSRAAAPAHDAQSRTSLCLPTGCCSLVCTASRPHVASSPQPSAAAPTLLHIFFDIHSALLPLRRRSGRRLRPHQPGEFCRFAKHTPTPRMAHSPARAHSLPSCRKSAEPFNHASQAPASAAFGAPVVARSRIGSVR